MHTFPNCYLILPLSITLLPPTSQSPLLLFSLAVAMTPNPQLSNSCTSLLPVPLCRKLEALNWEGKSATQHAALPHTRKKWEPGRARFYIRLARHLEASPSMKLPTRQKRISKWRTSNTSKCTHDSVHEFYSGAILLVSCCSTELIFILRLSKSGVQVDRWSSGQRLGSRRPPDDDWKMSGPSSWWEV